MRRNLSCEPTGVILFFLINAVAANLLCQDFFSVLFPPFGEGAEVADDGIHFGVGYGLRVGAVEAIRKT